VTFMSIGGPKAHVTLGMTGWKCSQQEKKLDVPLGQRNIRTHLMDAVERAFG